MLKLNIGCGTDIQPGYINIDTRKTHESVVIADVRSLPYQPNTVDEIRAIDVYEHVSFKESRKLLEHWVSLLKPNGLLYIQATSLMPLMDLADKANTIKEIETVIARIFGGQNYLGNYHYTAGHPRLLTEYLREAGITGDITIEDGNFGNRTNIRVWAWR